MSEAKLNETFPQLLGRSVVYTTHEKTVENNARLYPLDKLGNKLLKRAFDIVLSAVVLLAVLSWLIPVLAIFIKLTSKGPLFFVQPRTGYNNKTFLCWKLRSMHVNANADLQQAIRSDSRITGIGKFIRKFSLDELPQFYNVLMGDMSLIGPRPHMLKHTEEYSKEVGTYLQRHAVKPGITGLSQVMGYRGEIANKHALNNRVRIDIFYLKKWNFGLDLMIIFRTAKLLVLGDKNAY
ncbi:MAG: sugar transferase [Bacteroidota bacterium]